MNITHAILHSFDFDAGNSVYSGRELDLTERTARSYVQRQVRKVCSSADSRHATLPDHGDFASAIDSYLSSGGEFVEFSCEVARLLHAELRQGQGIGNLDVLVVDFEDDVPTGERLSIDVGSSFEVGDAADRADAVEDAMQRALDAAYNTVGPRRVAMLLLPRKAAFAHDMTNDGGVLSTEIVKVDATLPGPTQKIDTYIVVSADSRAVDFCDKKRSIAGQDVLVIPDCLLRCGSTSSTSEVIKRVATIVSDVAQEYGANGSEAAARAKAFVSQHAGEMNGFSTEELGERVFCDDETMKRRYSEKAREEDIPERVSVKRGTATRLVRNHRIKTDTGIEVIFPSEYSETSDYIAFIREPNGSIKIELRGIGSIQDR